MKRILGLIENVGRLSENKPLVFALLLIPFFEPTFIEHNLWSVDKVFFFFQLVAMIVAFICLVYMKVNITPLYFCVIGYQAYLCAVTFFSGGDVFGIISSSARVFTIATLLEIGLRENPITTLKVLRNLSLLLLAVMFITSVLFPQGLYISPEAKGSADPDNVNYIRYFLGHKNNVLPFLFPGFAAATVLWMREKNNESKIAALSFYFMLLVSLLIIDSKTSLVVCALLIAAAFISRTGLAKRLNPFAWFTAALVANISITIFRIQSYLPGITELLGRDVTFSGRTAIWDTSIKLFSERPIFGYGYEPTDKAKAHFLGTFTSPHNIYFTAAYYGGLIGLLFVVAAFALSFKTLLGRRTEIAAFMSSFLFAALIEGIFEPFGYGGLTMLVIPLVMAHCISSFDLATEELVAKTSKV